jgi:hypothetical protein
MSAALATRTTIEQSLPLPLELATPQELTTSIEEAVKEYYHIDEVKYNRKTQLRENALGLPTILDAFTQCSGICGTRDPVTGVNRSDRDQVSDAL